MVTGGTERTAEIAKPATPQLTDTFALFPREEPDGRYWVRGQSP